MASLAGGFDDLLVAIAFATADILAFEFVVGEDFSGDEGGLSGDGQGIAPVEFGSGLVVKLLGAATHDFLGEFFGGDGVGAIGATFGFDGLGVEFADNGSINTLAFNEFLGVVQQAQLLAR